MFAVFTGKFTMKPASFYSRYFWQFLFLIKITQRYDVQNAPYNHWYFSLNRLVHAFVRKPYFLLLRFSFDYRRQYTRLAPSPSLDSLSWDLRGEIPRYMKDARKLKNQNSGGPHAISKRFHTKNSPSYLGKVYNVLHECLSVQKKKKLIHASRTLSNKLCS